MSLTAEPLSSRTSGTSLTPEQVARYRRDGYLFPIPVLTPAEAALYRGRLESFEAREKRALRGALRHKSHLLFPWLWDLVHHPKILDAVEGILGPNFHCWSSSFFIKEAQDPGFVSWHQDSTYWGLSEPEVITAWVALSPSTIEAGAMKVIPGSQGEQVAHTDTYDANNMLTRGQELAVEVDESQAVDLVLQPGEMSLHHVRIFHGSEPNRAQDRRIGFAIRYIPTHVRQVIGPRDGAVLVRGVDAFNNFEQEPAPDGEMSPGALAAHQAAAERQAAILYAGTQTTSFENVVRN
ncbi:chlorinating enzyme [Stella humosa]|uniref:Chlorinating enzyme n=1 Tax=Stella humosa TaxID=94 RepID=A0A3N1MEI2_9PROT|nr:phytanoyl-CoA dioxygenase family protein [Stella humosa]ROQ01968.1 chlorinating enzyme [Stella humosa]BBK32357.1 syringomycin biosynthesis enzyme [Stella humosa]